MEESKERKISAGSYDMNKWLFGGYEKDIITTIYGPAGSGKTNLCMLVAVSQAKKGNKVIFIDTEGGFSVDRFKQICQEDWEKFLGNVILLKPVNFSEQEKSFEKLLKEIKNEKIGAIIVDGMTMLYRLELAEAIKSNKPSSDKSEGNQENIRRINSALAKQLRSLAEIARTRNIPVVITNQAYGDFLSEAELRAGKEKVMHMVGGNLLEYWSKCIIELKNERGKRSAVLKKHRSMPEKILEFEIIDRGIRKRGWI